MSGLNLDNYEAYLLDYAEGRLSPEEVAFLREFAHSHPELDIDLEDLVLPQLSQSSEVFENAAQLYKDLPDATDAQVLEYLEGQLDEAQSKAFEDRLLRDAQLRGRLNLFQ